MKRNSRDTIPKFIKLVQIRGDDEHCDQDVVFYIAGTSGIGNKADGLILLILKFFDL